ncbi:MAG: toll/interleukin-1 receptor domain-containing protein [Pseudomonadota bacterium]|uniref:toll/interleukin-1 receptor domain-containing protein n=1 Tax=Maricaulis sp. TaxID=1486257 RepID=UPI002603EF66|nr:toll/interleukin-1 receptor domain-containing protein [Maricaulis sp.]MED5550149.1 toll/interleukin-1 receptor domain-containing protein [Pseudomonadota bacterium]
MSLYDLLVLGCPERETRDLFIGVLRGLLAEGDVPESEVRLITDPADYLSNRNPRVPTVVACFSDLSANELTTISALITARVPVIPVAMNEQRFETFPEPLQSLNGTVLSPNMEGWTSAGAAILESVGLLRMQRRLFISYRRTEAREAAVQLHDQMAARGFQVFLDTHSIRPGRVFQDDLWQSLTDSDVMVMLDTATYFESKWTREEFGRAQSMGISILRLVWPGITPEETAELSEQRPLTHSDFDGPLLKADVLQDIVEKTERLRARSLAARHTEITGKLKAGAEAAGAKIRGAGAFRSISIELQSGDDAWAYPVIGVPTANMMYDIALRAAAADHARPFLVYDHTGITTDWLSHLGWLDESIGEVDFMRVADAADVLARRASG